MKGESKQNYYFTPIETKASAQSRPHVLSSHPGFNSSLTFGALNLSFQHSMETSSTKEEAKQNEVPVDSEKNNLNVVKETVHVVVKNLFKDAEVQEDLESNKEVDKYTHKFVSIQSNESCGFCKRRVRLRDDLRYLFIY